jgi:hypothetical protein
MEGRERRSIAFMALGFFLLVATIDSPPSVWRTAFLVVAWITFIIGFINMVAEVRK